MSNPQQPGEQPIQPYGQPGQPDQPGQSYDSPGQPYGNPGQPLQPGQPYPPAQYAPQPKRSRKGLIIGLSIGVAVLIIGGVVGGLFVSRAVNAGIASATSPSALAKLAVEEAKKQQKLPMSVDQYTTWESIEADGATVRYTYTLHDIDPTAVTADALEEVVRPQLCSTAATKELLKHHVTMDYVYNVDGAEPVEFEVTEADC